MCRPAGCASSWSRDPHPGVSCNPKSYTHIVLPPNMDSSSFARHHTRQAGLSQMGAKTDMILFLASTMQYCNITVDVLLLNNVQEEKNDNVVENVLEASS